MTVYASEIPNMQSGAKVPSGELGVVWMPNQYDWSEDMLKHEVMSKLAYDSFLEAVGLNRYQSLKELPVIDTANDPDELR